MATIFTMTVNTGSKSQGETQASEAALIGHAIDQVRQALPAKPSGTIYDRNGANIGSYTYSPVATK